MRKITITFLVFTLVGMIPGYLYAQEVMPVLAPAVVPAFDPTVEIEDDRGIEDDEQDKDDAKPVVDRVNEVMQKIYDQIIALKPKYKELADFNEKSLTKSASGFLSLHYETQTPSARGETYPFIFKIDIDPLKAKVSKSQSEQGYFDYPLPLINLQFSGYALKHPLRRQFDIQRLVDESAEELVDYQQQFMPLRFMIVAQKKTFKVNEPIYFKVVLLNASEHNILVKSLGKETLFFTLNRNVWGTQAGEAQTMSPREQRREESRKRAEMRKLLRQKKTDQGGQTILGPRTHVGDKTILHVGEALVVDFKGEGYKRVQDVEIRGIYQLNVKGLRPTAKVKIKIVDD